MNRETLSYTHFERLPLRRPVDRLDFMSSACIGRRVLDIGCLDETALVKRDTQFWLHSRICTVAVDVLGIDNSPAIPDEGLTTAPNGRIFKDDASRLSSPRLREFDPDIIVAGEFIEHIENPSEFLRSVKARFAGKTLVLSTPNGCSASNLLMGLAGREVQHPDHLYNFTFKTLNTMCSRVGFESWEIVPYRFFATEFLLRNSGARRLVALAGEASVRLLERIAPALSFGYIVVART